jgi:hypothetical protein
MVQLILAVFLENAASVNTGATGTVTDSVGTSGFGSVGAKATT